MIKKLVLLFLLSSFLMVFSNSVLADPSFTRHWNYKVSSWDSPAEACSDLTASHTNTDPAYYYRNEGAHKKSDGDYSCLRRTCYINPINGNTCASKANVVYTIKANDCDGSSYCDALATNPNLLPEKTDEECQAENGDSILTDPHEVDAIHHVTLDKSLLHAGLP
ncbi:hypothetical protein, partial [Halovibrio sp. HP20-50]|uniref:hypothetical protein n=1 Tax=Halovibrio sp. HP20-59 TaxID=3080275 RepID=UPI00294B9091